MSLLESVLWRQMCHQCLLQGLSAPATATGLPNLERNRGFKDKQSHREATEAHHITPMKQANQTAKGQPYQHNNAKM